MKTDIIKFSVKDRGRTVRGQSRNFDTAKLASIINGADVQERVKRRDLHGYLGHWPRERFGMEPKEAVIVDGRVVPIEPAIVTTLLRATPDGQVEHQAEFLDTPTGRTAGRMYQSRTGGFSSAISFQEKGGMESPVNFHGFDYVKEPNFSHNRGYALDSAQSMGDMVDRMALDAIIEEHTGALQALDATCNVLQSELMSSGEALARMQAEYEVLLGLLSHRSPADQRRIRAAMDDTGFNRPNFAITGSQSLKTLAGGFLDMPLAGFEPPKAAAGAGEDTASKQLSGFLRRVGPR